MKVKKLHVTNFLNIAEAELDFDDNMNFIYGQPASGKSAIFEAMLVTLSTYKRSSTYGEYVKQGEDFSTINLEIEILGKLAQFTTIINRVKGTTCIRSLDYNGETFEGAAVENWLKERNIDYYAKLMFAMQNEENIVNISPAERLVYIQKLFNFNFKDKKDKIKADQKELESQIIELNSKIAGNKSTIEHLSKEQSTEARSLTDETRSLYEQKIADTMKVISENQAIQEKINKLNSEINTLNIQILECDNEIKKANDIKTRLAESEKELANLQSENNSLAEKNTALEKSISEKQELERNIQAEAIELNNKYNSLKEEWLKYNTEISNVKSKIELVKQGICPNCGQPTTNLDNNLDEKLSDLEAKAKEADENCTTLRLKNLDKDNEFRQVGNELNNLRLDLRENKNKIFQNETRIRLLSQKNEEALPNIDELTNEKNYAIARKQEKQQELETYKVTKTTTQLFEEIKPLQDAINKDNIIIEKNALIMKTNSENKATCAELLIKNEKLLDNVVNLNNKVTTLKEGYEILNKTLPQYISKSICNNLQSKINKFIHKIFPKYEVRLETTDKGCDLKYTKDLTIVDEKRNKFLKADMSSGLERSLLSLAFKVSLAEAYKLDMFVGDEIDQSSNDKDAKTLMDSLINSKNFKQLFIISHKNAVLDHITENYKGNVYHVENGKFTKTNF